MDVHGKNIKVVIYILLGTDALNAMLGTWKL